MALVSHTRPVANSAADILVGGYRVRGVGLKTGGIPLEFAPWLESGGVVEVERFPPNVSGTPLEFWPWYEVVTLAHV